MGIAIILIIGMVDGSWGCTTAPLSLPQRGFFLSTTGPGSFINLGVSSLENLLNKSLSAKPKFGPGVFVAAGAAVVGNVTLGRFSSIWFNAVLRGDLNRIVIGHHSNIQDNCVIHLADDIPCLIGHYVTVGHGAILHACTVEDEVLVGMGSVVLDGARIGRQSLIGARALVTSGTQIPPGSLVLGSPAKVIRPLTKAERRGLKGFAEKYIHLAHSYSERGCNKADIWC
jgi:carbonic anhydrase/acetyltransferase-like protein (isoleucine patch superfamily)